MIDMHGYQVIGHFPREGVECVRLIVAHVQGAVATKHQRGSRRPHLAIHSTYNRVFSGSIQELEVYLTSWFQLANSIVSEYGSPVPISVVLAKDDDWIDFELEYEVAVGGYNSMKGLAVKKTGENTVVVYGSSMRALAGLRNMIRLFHLGY